jgi:Glycosyl hydrolases family 39
MRIKFLKTSFPLFIIFCFLMQNTIAQKIDTSASRVTTDVNIALPLIGSVKYRNANTIQSSNWLIGCETLDRDFADYEQYKEYLNPLGIKLLRMQGGWAKTEKVKGQYDWAWLDIIINDANNRGLKPWLQTSYGNTLYKGGGGANLGAGMPTSAEALTAYNKWVAAMVTRYKDKVKDWEVWNEPNFGDNTMNSPEMIADFNIRTAEIIKKIQPDAKISGLALGHIGYEYAERFFKRIAQKKKVKLFDNMTYHDYAYNPDANYHKVYLIKQALEKYLPGMKLRQGENGAPSGGGSGRGALWDYDWSELTQAKWDTRRMLGNLGHDIECSIFGIIEMAYTNGPINRLNYKGIIKSDSTKKVIRPKVAYYAIQNVTSIFDNSLERLKDLEHTNNIDGPGNNEHRYTYTTDRSLSVYGYQNKITKKQIYTIWIDENIPVESNKTKLQTFSFSNADFDTPVFVDIITGAVYEIPATQWSKKGNTYIFKDIPVYDAPILIADKSLINLTK